MCRVGPMDNRCYPLGPLGYPRFVCHPGVRRTITFLRQHFWWPSLNKDVRESVAICPVCACNKSSTKHLRPTPPINHTTPPLVTHRLSFLHRLPASSGRNVILTIVDRFSKSAQFIALEKLPTVIENAQLLVDHVFRLHGISQEIVSDRGPQFTSRVWKTFCTALGARVNLSSGYHPQTNSQTERLNQELESTLYCVLSHNPLSWSTPVIMD